MNRYYIDKLGIKHEDTPQGWNENDPRQKDWEEERQVVGFDERDTWSLNYTMDLLLYERLCMYREIAKECLDLSFHKFNYKNKSLTQGECLDKMIDGLKLQLTLGDFDERRKDPVIRRKIDCVYEIYTLCRHSLWW